MIADPTTLEPHAAPADPTLDELRLELAPAIAANAAFDGWSEAALAMAAEGNGVDPDIATLAFAGDRGVSAVEMIDAWFATIDMRMAEVLPPEALATMKIRARIILAMPQNVARAAKLGWRSVDAIWRLAGDTATDYNHYTKRTILLGVYGATVTVFLNDESEGHADTRAFLDRRIDGIMRFEKAKAGFLKRTEHRPSLSRFIGRLRYPAV